jgi:hypothetical protein
MPDNVADAVGAVQPWGMMCRLASSRRRHQGRVRMAALFAAITGSRVSTL